MCRRTCSVPRLLLPDPVHHERGAVLEDIEVFFLYALRGIQEQVEVQMTRSLDLDFSAHAFWQKCGRGGFRFPPLTCSLAKGFRPPYLPSSQLSPLSPPDAKRPLGLPSSLLPCCQHSPFFFWVGLVDPSRWDKEVPRTGATSSGKS